MRRSDVPTPALLVDISCARPRLARPSNFSHRIAIRPWISAPSMSSTGRRSSASGRSGPAI